MTKSFNRQWEEIHKERNWGRYPSEYLIRFIARNYYSGVRAETKILDFGCGAGASTWYLAREGFDTYAFDGSESAVKRTLAYLDQEGLSAEVKVCDALAIDYPENYFDAVIDNYCIYSNTLEHIKTMYREVYHILKPGGKIFTSCFGKKTLGYGTGTELEPDTFVDVWGGVLEGRGTTHFFSQQQLQELLQEAGFLDLQIDTVLRTDQDVLVEEYIVSANKNR